MIVHAMHYLKQKNITLREENERQWGSWELLLQNPQQGPRFFRCGVFGWGYTTEQAFAQFLQDHIDNRLPYEQVDAFRQYLGGGVVDEMIEAMKEKEIINLPMVIN